MFGGIPNSEIKDYEDFWNAFPSLKDELFQSNNEPYSTLKSDNVKNIIKNNQDVQHFMNEYKNAFNGFETYLKTLLIDDANNLNIAKTEEIISNEIFNRLKNIPLINQYEAYQYLNDEWNMISGDIEIIQTEGIDAAKVVDPNMVLKKKKDKEVEVQEGWIGHLLPFDLIQSKYLINEKRELIYKENQVSEIDSEINDIIENLTDEEKEMDEPLIIGDLEPRKPSFMVDVDDEPTPVETKKEVPVVNEGVVEKVEPKHYVADENSDFKNYKLPKLNVLEDMERKSRSNANVTTAKEKGEKLIEILHEFGVEAKLVQIHIGPSVTKFEIKPELGVRVNKISNLQNDIKMGLAAKDIRIEAPIPGKASVGIEIPNVEKTSVQMKDLMRTIPDSMKDKKLLFCLGKDLMGNNVYGELNRMPHLLIAGATGSGKSVCVNAIISSVLMRTKPDEVKLVLIDPKKVEFTPYNDVPHLLSPVITDGDLANKALKVIVEYYGI